MSNATEITKTGKPFMGSIASEGTVIVKIGAFSKQYQVHQSLLVRHSEYFRKALEGPWKEAQERMITLRDVEPRVFALFVHWLYTQEFAQGQDDFGLSVTEPEQDAAEALEMCTKAYIFGDRFLAPEFRRAANNYFGEAITRDWLITKSDPQTLIHAFENIPADRVMVQALIDDFCASWNEKNTDFYSPTTMSCLSPAILRRMVKQMRDHFVVYLEHPKSPCYLEHVSETEQGTCPDMHMRWDEKTELAHFE